MSSRKRDSSDTMDDDEEAQFHLNCGLEFMQEKGYMVRQSKDSDAIDILFFAHPKSLQLLKLFPYLVVMDTRCKTNGCMLLEIVGMTCTDKTFNIGFAYMFTQDLPSYIWVLTQLRNVFEGVGVRPTAIMTDREQALIDAIHQVFTEEEVLHLLCWMHVTDDIETYATTFLRDEDKGEEFADECWYLFRSITETIYEDKLKEISASWGMELVSYVEKTWLRPYKKNIVCAWTDNRHHFFTRTTDNGRVEGMHQVLEDVLDTFAGDFMTMILAIHDELERQLESVRESLDTSHVYIPKVKKEVQEDFRMLFSPLFHRVSKMCFQHLYVVYYDAVNAEANDHEVCNDRWWGDCLGIPCAHRIASALKSSTPIMPSEIHLFWKQVVWQGVTDEDALDDETVRHTVAYASCRLLKDKYERGELSRDQELRILSVFEKCEAEQGTMIPKENPKRSTENKNDHTLPSSKRVARKKRLSNKGHTELLPSNEAARATGEVVYHKGIYFGFETVDLFMFAYIENARNVKADGHCGYRALACLLGWDETQYGTLRWQLCAELCRNKHIYEPASIQTPFDELIMNVNHVLSPCTQRFWMEMPMIGLAFATLYQVVLVVLSWDLPHTCFPMTMSNVNQSPPTRILAIALLENENHYIPVSLSQSAPLPPTTLYWNDFHHPSVNGWDKPFKQRMELFRKYRVQYGRRS